MPSDPCFLRFWGVRGSIPTPGPSTLFYGGNTSCVEVRADGEIIILDAGTGIRVLGLALKQEFSSRSEPLSVTVLLSHSHWDHIQGFPFFHPAYDQKNQVTLCGFNETASGLKGAIAGQMESPYFPISLSDMSGNIEIRELAELEFNIGKVRVTAFPAWHPGGAMGYRLSTSGGTFVYMPDNEVITEDDRENPPQAAARSAAPTVNAADVRGWLLEFIRAADVLVHDSQYTREEYDCHRGWGHGCVDEVVTLAIDAGVKRLELFHHDPEHDDEAIGRMVEKARVLVALRGSPLKVEAAREGLTVSLGGG